MKIKLRRIYRIYNGMKESYPFYVYIFKNKDSNTVIGESLLTGNTLFIRKKRVDEVFKELRQIKL
jgi:hypothetical protein